MLKGNYSELAEFHGIFLEDSFVLSINENPGQVEFIMEFVLTRDHPNYRPPKSGEQYCYTPGVLIFQSQQVRWLRGSTGSFRDSSGEIDLGNIDSLTLTGPDVFFVEGDWGQIEIVSDLPPVVKLSQ